MGNRGPGVGSTLGWEKKGTPKATISPTLRQIEWAAGFLEGEGTFEKCRVRASQKQKEPLTRLKKYFGGTITINAYDYLEPIYRWNISGSRARGVMLTLYRLMSPRRQKQIRKGLN